MTRRLLWMVVCCLPFVSGCKQSECAISETAIDDTIYQNLPFEMPKVQQPVFPAYEVNISKFGAKGDGMTLNTKAINDAIKEVNQRGGGKVIIPEGTWLTGPIELLSNVNLYTERNALVLFTGDFEAYPIIPTSFEGLETRRCQSPISARNAENIAITGYGIFDGNGDCWRPVKKEKLTASQWNKLVKSGGVLDEQERIWYPTAGSLKGAMACKDFNVPEGINTDEEWNEIRAWLRPVLLSFVKSKKILLEGVTFKNSPSWCLHPLSCEDFTVNNIQVINPWYSQNGDALDLESCKNALILNSVFDAGDDAICIKSGKILLLLPRAMMSANNGYQRIGSQWVSTLPNISVSFSFSAVKYPIICRMSFPRASSMEATGETGISIRSETACTLSFTSVTNISLPYAKTKGTLSVADAVEYVEVIMKYGSHFRFMPFQLMRFGYNDFRLCNTQYTVHKEEKECI